MGPLLFIMKKVLLFKRKIIFSSLFFTFLHATFLKHEKKFISPLINCSWWILVKLGMVWTHSVPVGTSWVQTIPRFSKTTTRKMSEENIHYQSVSDFSDTWYSTYSWSWFCRSASFCPWTFKGLCLPTSPALSTPHWPTWTLRVNCCGSTSAWLSYSFQSPF